MRKDNFKSRSASRNTVIDLTPYLPEGFVPDPESVVKELQAIKKLSAAERKRQHVSPVSRSEFEKR